MAGIQFRIFGNSNFVERRKVKFLRTSVSKLWLSMTTGWIAAIQMLHSRKFIADRENYSIQTYSAFLFHWNHFLWTFLFENKDNQLNHFARLKISRCASSFASLLCHNFSVQSTVQNEANDSVIIISGQFSKWFHPMCNPNLITQKNFLKTPGSPNILNRLLRCWSLTSCLFLVTTWLISNWLVQLKINDILNSCSESSIRFPFDQNE